MGMPWYACDTVLPQRAMADCRQRNGDAIACLPIPIWTMMVMCQSSPEM